MPKLQSAKSQSTQSLSVQDWNDQYLALFPNRYDYIYANHPEPGQRPDWKTESRHPLSDRLIQQGAYLYGVRFGKTTEYLVLDVDIESFYHPLRDRFAVSRMMAALEPLNLVSFVACSSSYSGGLHLYIPFQSPQKTWEVALAVTILLENAGFKVAPGQLEVFPNRKPYSTDPDTQTLYNAHRLPLQAGSYLLNQDWQMIYTDQSEFVRQWRFAQSRNDLDSKTLHTILKQHQRRQYKITSDAAKFLNDLNAEIEAGWTGHGQTNRLLGRVAIREFVFGHVLYGGSPLEGEDLAASIVQVARSLSGYTEWCRHQFEIENKAAEWARCIESSRYYHYSNKPIPSLDLQTLPLNPQPNWNKQQSAAARERIITAIANLLENGTLPSSVSDRFKALKASGIGSDTLYAHKDLWHPDYLQNQPEPLQNQLFPPIHSKSSDTESPEPLQNQLFPPITPISLGELGACAPSEQQSAYCLDEKGGSGGFSTGASDPIPAPPDPSSTEQGAILPHPTSPIPSDPVQVQSEVVEAVSLARRQIEVAKANQERLQEQKHIAQREGWLRSGDPILGKEAQQWFWGNQERLIEGERERLGWDVVQLEQFAIDQLGCSQFQLSNQQCVQLWLLLRELAFV